MIGQRPVKVLRLFNAKTLDKNANATSVAVDLREICQNNKFSVLYTIAGTGTVKMEYVLSATKGGATFTGATPIVSAAASGGATDLKAFTPELSAFMQIKITENNVNPITSLDLWLMVQ